MLYSFSDIRILLKLRYTKLHKIIQFLNLKGTEKFCRNNGYYFDYYSENDIEKIKNYLKWTKTLYTQQSICLTLKTNDKTFKKLYGN